MLEFQLFGGIGKGSADAWLFPTIGIEVRRRENYPYLSIVALVGHSSYGLRIYWAHWCGFKFHGKD